MLTGKLPMEEAESKDPLKKMLVRSFGAIKPISEHRYAPDEELADIIEKMMKMELKARYQTMDDVVRDLEHYEASVRPAGDQHTRAPEFERDRSGSRVDSESIFMAAVGLEDLAPPPAEPVATAAAQPVSAEAKSAPGKTVLCVEAQTDIQDALRKTLSQMGYRVLLVRDAELAAERYREAPTDAVIFDTDGQDEDCLDAFVDMHEKAHEEEGHQLSAVVLLGHKQEALREKLPEGDRLVVLIKPLKMKQLQEAIYSLVRPK
jgi:eukaryotic-like serine/threonine-protein kinase